MKVAVITDTHFQIKGGKDSFERHILRYTDMVIDYCIKNKINTILHLGDFFDVRNSISIKTLKSVKTNFLDVLKKNKIKIHIIPGNHDLAFKNTHLTNSVSLLFNEYDNVFVYNEPTKIEFEDGTTVVMCPWLTPENKAEFGKIAMELGCESNILCGHFEFKGFEYQRGVKATNGDDSEGLAGMYTIVLSGHYHSKSRQGNVYYLGTGCDLTWADYNEKKYFHILDTSNAKLKQIENPDRMFIQIVYDESLIDQKSIQELKELNFNDKVIKILIKNRKNAILFDEFLEELYNQKPDSITVIENTTDIQEVKIDNSLLLKSTIELLNGMIDEMDVNDNIDKNEVKKICFELYQESMI